MNANKSTELRIAQPKNIEELVEKRKKAEETRKGILKQLNQAKKEIAKLDNEIEEEDAPREKKGKKPKKDTIYKKCKLNVPALNDKKVELRARIHSEMKRAGFFIGFRVLNRTLDQESALLMNYLIGVSGMGKNKSDWFYRKWERIEEDIGFSKKAQARIIKKLVAVGVLQAILKGAPPKRYFWIDYEKIAKLVKKEMKIDLTKTRKERDKLDLDDPRWDMDED